MATVDFHFDPISPYSWLAWSQMEALKEQTGATVRFVPVLFAGLLNAHGNKGPAEIPAKREYTFRDALRWATKLGLPFQGPPAHPFNPLKALRMCVAIEGDRERERFAGAILDDCWGRGLDLTNDAVLIEAARLVGLDGQAYLERAGRPDVKDRLRIQTEEAIARGVFGVPTFAVGKDLFWGNDRIPFLIDHLQGKLPIDEAQLREWLARPRAADRK